MFFTSGPIHDSVISMTSESVHPTKQPELGPLVPEIIALLGGIVSAIIVILPVNTFIGLFAGALTPLVAPFVEEPLKVIGVAYLAAWYPSTITSKTRGFLLGGLAGLGFAFTENIVYLMQGIGPETVIARALLPVPMHIGASSLVGAGLVFLGLTASSGKIQNLSDVFQRIQTYDILYFLGLAVIFHFVYNLMASLNLLLAILALAGGLYAVYRLYQFVPEDFGNLVIDSRTNNDLLQKALSSEPAGYQVRASVSFCPHCGAKVGEGDTFCTQCGERIR